MRDLAASLDDRGRKSLLEDIAATEGESQPALPDRHIQIATRALTNLVLLFSKGSHAVAEELLAAVTGQVLGECVTPKLDQKIVDNLVHTFSMVQTDFGPQAVTLCDVICAAAAPSHRDPKLDVNGFYNLQYISDRCRAEFSNHNLFYFLSMHEKLLSLPATWCFDMPGHGKGTCDGLGAGIKKMLGNWMCGLEDVPSPIRMCSAPMPSDKRQTFAWQVCDFSRIPVFGGQGQKPISTYAGHFYRCRLHQILCMAINKQEREGATAPIPMLV